jgi:gluconokinase
VHFIHLDAPESELRRRAEARQNHFAKSNLVHSQFDALERPRITEADATIVSVIPPPEEVQNEVLDTVMRLLGVNRRVVY